MCVRESHPLARELVEMRRGDLRFGAVATDIAIPEVIGEDDEDVWRRGVRHGDGEKEGERAEKFHARGVLSYLSFCDRGLFEDGVHSHGVMGVPVISERSLKNPRLRGLLMPQFTGTLW